MHINFTGRGIVGCKHTAKFIIIFAMTKRDRVIKSAVDGVVDENFVTQRGKHASSPFRQTVDDYNVFTHDHHIIF